MWNAHACNVHGTAADEARSRGFVSFEICETGGPKNTAIGSVHLPQVQAEGAIQMLSKATEASVG